MLNENFSSDSVTPDVLRKAVSDALHDPEFVCSLAEKIADILGASYAQYPALKLDELKIALGEGIESGKGNAVEQVFDRLEKKYAAMTTGHGV